MSSGHLQEVKNSEKILCLKKWSELLMRGGRLRDVPTTGF